MEKNSIKIITRFELATDKAKYLALAISGAACAFAFAPWQIWPLWLLSYAYLFIIIRSVKQSKAFKFLITFYLSQFMFSLSWVASAFDVAGMSEFKLMGTLGLPLLVSLMLACPIALLHRPEHSMPQAALRFTIIVSLAEWSRSFVLSGFPWNMPSHIWPLPMLQSAALWGSFGLNFITVFLATLIPQYIKKLQFCGLILLASLWGFGEWRLANNQVEFSDVAIRLVQPNIDQVKKWDPAYRMENMIKQVKLSKKPSKYNLSAVVWPEAAATFFVDTNKSMRDYIATAAPESGYLITGAPRRIYDNSTVTGLHSTLTCLSRDGKVHTTYNKQHLVPFGEFIPFRKLLPLPKVTAGSLDYKPGSGPKTIQLNKKLKFSPLICFDAIFPGQVDLEGHRPDWLLNITNDTWFGESAGPAQHFQIVRLRAIEEGLPMLRAANNGISAVVDPWGRVIRGCKLLTNDTGVIDTLLPKPILNKTLFAKLCNFPYWLLVVLFTLLYYSGRRRERIKETNERNRFTKNAA